MKNIVLILCLLNGFLALSQTIEENQLLSGRLKRHGIYVQTGHDTAFLFGLAGMLDKAGVGSVMIYSDTLVRQPGNSTSYKGPKSFLEKRNDRFTLTLLGFKSSGPATLDLEMVSKPEIARHDINNGYWWKRYLQLDSQLAKEFTMYNFTWRNGFSQWESFPYKDLEFQEFAKLAEARLQEVKDSITSAEAENNSIARRIVDRIATVEFATVKDALERFTPSYEQRYFHTLVDYICKHRPELFFPLAEALPQKRNDIFDVGYFNKEHRKALKAVQTDSPTKAEFFRRKKG